jgi:DNA-binding winged helix-turn-helix (wHTH) protein
LADPTQHPWPAGTRRLRVHDVQIDLRYRRVIRPDQEAELPQRMFELLLVFLAEPQVLHNRSELFARVWPGVIVEDANLSQSVWMLRKALGESSIASTGEGGSNT